MRDTITGTWLYTLVVIFIVIFSSYLAISVNYYNVYNVKNTVVNLIEKGEGHSCKAQQDIEQYLTNSNYNTYGNCGANGDGFIKSTINNKTKYCISSETRSDVTTGMPATYYTVTLFFKFDLPVIGNILTFKITGETKAVYNAQNC